MFPERESDQRRLRERGVEEGVLAERALRRLASASRGRNVEVVAKKGGLRHGAHGERSQVSGRQVKREVDGAAMFAEMLKEAGQGSREVDDAVAALAAGGGEGLDFGSQDGVIVNWDTGGWRRGGGQSVRVR